MEKRSPTLDGFRTMFRQPALGLAEVGWRWSFGFATAWLALASLIEFLDTLPVSRMDRLLLRSRQPFLASQAVGHIFRGSGWRLMESAILVSTALAAGWVVTSSIGRSASLRALTDHFSEAEEPERVLTRWSLRPLLGLQFLRVALALAAATAFAGALLAPATLSGKSRLSPTTEFLLVSAAVLAVWITASLVNWFLSIATIYAGKNGRDTFAAVAAAVELCRHRAGAVTAVSTWFGLAHFGAFCVASVTVTVPLAMTGSAPGWMIGAGVLLVTLGYFFVVDFLYVGRLAAYVAVAEWPNIDPDITQPILVSPFVGGGVSNALNGGIQVSTSMPSWSGTPSERVDQSENILSDQSLPEAGSGLL